MEKNNENKKGNITSDEERIQYGKEKRKKILSNTKGKAKNKNYFSPCIKKFFLEDYVLNDSIIINPNKELNYYNTFNDFFKNNLKTESFIDDNFQNILDKIYEYYIKFKKCETIFVNDLKDLELASDSGINDYEKMKSINEIKFDLVLKCAKGEKINNYIAKIKDDCFQYIKSFEIEKDRFYNLCFEINVSSKDIFKVKIPQILKYAIWLNFLYDTYSIIKDQSEKFGENEGKRKIIVDNENIKEESGERKKYQLKEEISNNKEIFIDQEKEKEINYPKAKILEDLLEYYENKFKFIDLNKKTVLFVVTKRSKEELIEMKSTLENSGDTKIVQSLIEECKYRYNLNFNYINFFKDDLKNEIVKEFSENKVNEETRKTLEKIKNELSNSEKELKILLNKNNEDKNQILMLQKDSKKEIEQNISVQNQKAKKEEEERKIEENKGEGKFKLFNSFGFLIFYLFLFFFLFLVLIFFYETNKNIKEINETVKEIRKNKIEEEKIINLKMDNIVTNNYKILGELKSNEENKKTKINKDK